MDSCRQLSSETMHVCCKDKCLYFLTNKRTPRGVGRVWSAVSRPLRMSQKYTSKYAFLYSSPRKLWSLLWLFDCHLCKYSFLFSCCFIFISLGVGGKVLHENAFLSHLWLHFECHRFLRIDRIICTHHFADAKKELWTLGTFLGVFASF